MMRISLLVTFCYTVATCALGQQLSNVQSADSTAKRRFTLPETELWLSKPTLFTFPSHAVSTNPFELPGEFFGYEPVKSPTFVGGFMDKRTDLMTPLLLQWESESRMRPFQIVLGSLSAGTAVYAAYRHIKKYGLFK
jgi:hypothetical protein